MISKSATSSGDLGHMAEKDVADFRQLVADFRQLVADFRLYVADSRQRCGRT